MNINDGEFHGSNLDKLFITIEDNKQNVPDQVYRDLIEAFGGIRHLVEPLDTFDQSAIQLSHIVGNVARAKVTELEGEVRDLQDEIENLEQDKQALEDDIATLDEEKEEADKLSTDLAKQVDEFITVCKKQDKEVGEIKTKLSKEAGEKKRILSAYQLLLREKTTQKIELNKNLRLVEYLTKELNSANYLMEEHIMWAKKGHRQFPILQDTPHHIREMTKA